jgi:transglutaminase/protease-like cytokinesis protein 3
MEDRETFEIVTPIKGHKVVLRSWITGRESQKIDGAMFKGVGTTSDGKKLTPKLSESMLSDQENASIEVVVVSVDGKENDVVNSVLNMRAKDYSFVTAEVQKVVDGDVPEKKENSSETSTTKSSPEIKT